MWISYSQSNILLYANYVAEWYIYFCFWYFHSIVTHTRVRARLSLLDPLINLLNRQCHSNE